MQNFWIKRPFLVFLAFRRNSKGFFYFDESVFSLMNGFTSKFLISSFEYNFKYKKMEQFKKNGSLVISCQTCSLSHLCIKVNEIKKLDINHNWGWDDNTKRIDGEMMYMPTVRRHALEHLYEIIGISCLFYKQVSLAKESDPLKDCYSYLTFEVFE